MIQPDYPKDFRYGLKTSMHYSPLGLEYIAAHVRDIAETRILDNRPNNSNRVKNVLADFRPDYVGISCNFSFQIHHVLSLAKLAKDYGAITVLGGWHPTLAPDNTLAFPWVDVVVRSEGELTFRDLIRKNTPKGVQGLSYKQNGSIIHNTARELANLDHLRLPARDLLTDRARYNFFGIPIEIMETSRGCPYNCKFCCIHEFYAKKYRHRSVPHIMRELLEIKNHCSYVQLIDDNFMVNPKHALALCDEIIRHKLNMIFMTTVRVDSVIKHPKVYERMAKAGFISLYLGIESFSDKALKNLNKQFQVRETVAAIKFLRKIGFLLLGSVILGANYDDTEQDLQSTIENAKALDLDLLSFNFLIPYPGTQLAREVEDNGLLLSKNWRDYTWYVPLIKYEHLTSDQLIKWLDIAYQEAPLFSNPGARFIRLFQSRGIPFAFSRLCNLMTLKSAFTSIKNIIQKS